MFTPVLAKHTKSFNLIDTLAVGVDRIQRSFEPMRRQVEEWRQAQITDERAKLILYAAFVDGKLEAPSTLLPQVHRLYFQLEYEEFCATDDVEPVECVYQRIQGTRPRSPIQSDGEAGRVYLSVVCVTQRSPRLRSGNCGRGAPPSDQGTKVMFEELIPLLAQNLRGSGCNWISTPMSWRTDTTDAV